MAKSLVVAASLLAVLPVIAFPVEATPTTHVGCMYYGWWATLPITPSLPDLVPFVMSSAPVAPDANLICDQYPAPYPNMNPQWGSWSQSCAGVAPSNSVNGAWCGGPVAPSGEIHCTLKGYGAMLVGVDRNMDGYVNEFDAAGRAPLVSEVVGVGSPTSPSIFLTKSPGWAPGGRIIAYPVMSPTWGATGPSSLEVSCV